MIEKHKELNSPFGGEYEDFDEENDKSPPTNKKGYTKYSIKKKMPKLIQIHNKYQNTKKEDKMIIEIEESSEKDSVETKIKAISFKINKIDNKIEDIEKEIDKNTTKFWGVKILKEKSGLLEDRNRLEEEKKALILIKESQEEKKDLSDDKIEVSKFPNIKGNKKTKRINAENNTQINEEITKYATNADITTKYSNFLKNPVILKYFFDTLLYTLINIIDFINKRANSKYKIELEDISKRDEFDINKDNFRDILNGNMYDIFIGKHWKTSKNNDLENYEKIKKIINSLLQNEKNNNKKKMKLLSILFYSNVKTIYINSLENNHFIKSCDCVLYLKISTVNDFKGYDEELNNKVIEYLSSSEISQAEDEKINNNTLYSSNQNNIDQKGKNNTKKFYHIRRKIIRMCITSIELIIKSIYYIYSSDKLTDITIKNQFGKNFQKYQLFFKKKLISIYFDSRPKKFIIGKKYNVKEINQALEKEKQENTEENRILYKLMNIDLETYLIPFLNDEKKIIKRDEYGNKIEEIDLPVFKTYKDCINEEYKYTEKEIEIFKKDMLDIIINGNIKSREPSQKRNDKLKGKTYNNRKTK